MRKSIVLIAALMSGSVYAETTNPEREMTCLGLASLSLYLLLEVEGTPEYMNYFRNRIVIHAEALEEDPVKIAIGATAATLEYDLQNRSPARAMEDYLSKCDLESD